MAEEHLRERLGFDSPGVAKYDANAEMYYKFSKKNSSGHLGKTFSKETRFPTTFTRANGDDQLLGYLPQRSIEVGERLSKNRMDLKELFSLNSSLSVPADSKNVSSRREKNYSVS